MVGFLSYVAGWIGAALILLAYALLTAQKLSPRSVTYHGMNFFGAFGVLFNAFVQRAWPGAVLEIAWAAIALWAIGVATIRKRGVSSQEHSGGSLSSRCDGILDG